MKTFFLWFLAGFGLAAVAVAALTVFSHSGRVAGAREGWDLVPVVVLGRDVPEGQALTFEDLTQRQLPSQFASASVVTPNDVSRVVGRGPSMPLKKGDLLLWAAFTDYSATDECFGAIASKVKAAKDKAREDALASFQARMGAPPPEPEPVPMPQADASGEVSVVVIKAQAAEGQVLEAPMLGIGKRPKALVTASFIPAGKLRDVAGARLLVTLEANDALMWQMLDDARQPRRVHSCMLEVGKTLNEAHERARREEAATFVRGKEAR